MISYKKIYHFVVWCLFIAFLGLFIAYKSGYTSSYNEKKTYLTNESIKRFEKDIESGKEIKVENYVVNMQKNYDNRISKFGKFTSKIFGKTFKWGMTKTFEAVDKVMEDN